MKSFSERLYCRLEQARVAEHSDNHDEYRYGPEEWLTKPEWLRRQLRRASRRLGFYRLSWMQRPNPVALTEWMSLLPELEWLSSRLADDTSRDLLVAIVAYRIMGPRGIKLPLSTKAYRQRRKELESLGDPHDSIDTGFLGWSLLRHNLSTLGGPPAVYVRDPITVFDVEEYAHLPAGIRVEEGDVVIDGGGCYGDTAIYFAHRAGASGAVHVFEFVPSNVAIMKRNLELDPEVARRVTVVETALWSVSGQAVHVKDAGPASRISSTPMSGYDAVALTTTIDDYVKQAGLARVDFIKLDIEGAEEGALLGAARTIRQMRPRMAVSLYHSPDDFARLPRLLDLYCPEYEFHIKHATMHAEETVLLCKST